ncbi:MAG: type II toxin-antitoxin system HicA family toxin [Oceanicaulis sp.]
MEFERDSRKIARLLERDGFERIGAKGSHVKFRKAERTVILPHPKKDLPLGTVRAIYRQAGWL